MKNKKLAIVIKVILFIAIIVSIGFLGKYIYEVTLSSSASEWDDKAYKGVSACGVDVGGKSENEIVIALKTDLADKLDDKRLIVKAGSRIFSYTYKDLDIQYDFEKAAKEAVEYGKDFSITKKISLIRNEENDLYEIKLDAKPNVDRLEKVEEDIKGIVNVDKQDAKIKVQNGQIVIEPDVIGGKLEDGEAKSKIAKAINGDLEEEENIELPVEEEEADIKASDLEKINGVMSSFQTDYSSSSAERAFNVELATSLVDKTLLMPGKEFSYSEVSKKGRGRYKDAGVYINNKVEQAEAGGICQVSTTLYRAAMKSNIRSVERLNHSLQVGYANLGLDATVSWGSIDYRFKNTYDFPIYIEGIASGGVVTFNIYGDKSALGNKTYDMESEIVETYAPTNSYVDDASMPIGTEVFEQYGTTGYKVNSYQITYENAVAVNRELIATDNYSMTQNVIKRGTAPVPAQVPAQNQVPTNTQTGQGQNAQLIIPKQP